MSGHPAYREELVVGSQRRQVRQPVGHREQRGDGPRHPRSRLGQACGPGPLQIVIYEFRGAGGDHQGRVDDGALPGVQRGDPGITGYGVGELRVPRADPQNPAVRHDAVGAGKRRRPFRRARRSIEWSMTDRPRERTPAKPAVELGSAAWVRA